MLHLRGTRSSTKKKALRAVPQTLSFVRLGCLSSVGLVILWSPWISFSALSGPSFSGWSVQPKVLVRWHQPTFN